MNKFVLSVIHDGQSIKESGNRGSKQVAIPFGSEYKIRLKNKNDRDCTARVTIDGSPVSNFGDIIVGAGSAVDLERFITNSMSNGKRFKFVELEHPDVDDPTRSDNGIIRVEFRLAKKKDIKIDWDWRQYSPPYQSPPIPYKFKENNDGMWRYETWYVGDPVKNSDGHNTAMYCASTTFNSNVADGATIEGENSNQSFTCSSLDVEASAVVLQLKIVGIKSHRNNVSQSGIVQKAYCTHCGYVIKKTDKYCGGCGRRL